MAAFIVIDSQDKAWTVEHVDTAQKAVDKLVKDRAGTIPVLVVKVANGDIRWNAAHSIEHKYSVVARPSVF